MTALCRSRHFRKSQKKGFFCFFFIFSFFFVIDCYCKGIRCKVMRWVPCYHCRQLRFSLYSAAVTTKALAIVVLLYYLSHASVDYPMPYALLPSLLQCCWVLFRLSSTCPCCSLLNAAQLVLLCSP